MFLETLVDFIMVHKEDLQDWLFVLLTQLLKKMGADLLGSVQAKVQKALDVTRLVSPAHTSDMCMTKYSTSVRKPVYASSVWSSGKVCNKNRSNSVQGFWKPQKVELADRVFVKYSGLCRGVDAFISVTPWHWEQDSVATRPSVDCHCRQLFMTLAVCYGSMSWIRDQSVEKNLNISQWTVHRKQDWSQSDEVIDLSLMSVLLVLSCGFLFLLAESLSLMTSSSLFSWGLLSTRHRRPTSR